MAREFKAGDVLIFQLESGFGLLKVLAIDESATGEAVWHLAAFEDLYLDSEMADNALQNIGSLRFSEKHLALTNRAFESTPTARMGNYGVADSESGSVAKWRENPNRKILDTSIRLLLGLR